MTPDEMRERSNEYLEVSAVNGDLPDAVSTLLFLVAEICERLDKLIDEHAWVAVSKEQFHSNDR